ncbi:MAG: serine/threonine-protein kinase [Polyangiaceae bacterium]
MAADDPTRDSSSSTSESSTFRPGMLLEGRYRLVRPLGEGGMGTVWVAHQIVLERDVAIKSCCDGWEDHHKARLRREALALATIRHPSVVQVFDLGELPGGLPFIVMELIEGESLAQRIEREGPLDAVEAVSLVLPLLDGLSVAHASGVVHRDLKPENVLLANAEAGVRAKLVDFGIARLDRSSTRLTVDGSFVGTPAFMAPEQIRGVGDDERVDVWGAAALLYATMTGSPPFVATDILGLLRRVVEEPPSYPRAAKSLDGKLWRILMDAMRKDPGDRTATVAALRDELSAWLEKKGPPSSKNRPIAAVGSAISMVTTAPPPSSWTQSQANPSDAGPPSNGAPLSSDAEISPEGIIDTLIRQKLRDT